MVELGGVAAGGRSGGGEVAATHQSVGDYPCTCPDRDGVFTRTGCVHAAIGCEVGQALVVQLEQQASGDVVRVGRQSVYAQTVIAVQRDRGGVELREQSGKVVDQL